MVSSSTYLSRKIALVIGSKEGGGNGKNPRLETIFSSMQYCCNLKKKQKTTFASSSNTYDC